MVKKKSTESGFTILELIVAISIFALLVSLALPVNRELKESNYRNMALRNLQSDITKAQARSFSTGNRGIFTTENNGTSYAFGLDVYPYNVSFSAETSEFTRTLPKGVTLTIDDDIVFDPRGYIINDSELLVSRTLTLRMNSVAFRTLTLYPTGVLE